MSWFEGVVRRWVFRRRRREEGGGRRVEDEEVGGERVEEVERGLERGRGRGFGLLGGSREFSMASVRREIYMWEI